MSSPAERTAGTTLESPAIHRLLRRAVVFPVVIVLLLCSLLGWQIRGLLHEYGWVTHTEQVLAQINLAQRLLVDHETALRAHLVVGEPEFLAPYRDAERHLPGALAELATRTADNAAQQTRVAELRRLYDEWKALADHAIGGPPPCTLPDRSAVLADMRDRKQRMDTMRSVVAAMVDEERALMQSRQANVARADRFVLISSAVLGLLLTVALVLVFRRWLVQLDANYRRILDQRTVSEERERQARTAAEALAADIQAQSHALEARFTELRAELEELRRKS